MRSINIGQKNMNISRVIKRLFSKCSRKKHIFEGDNRKCDCGQADIYWVACATCKVPQIVKHLGESCEDCMSSFKYKRWEKRYSKKKSVGIKTYMDAVAFGYDKATGRPLAIDGKGRTFDADQTRYDLRNDRHGWKATGKK